ncbi:MAG: NEW3 domain-containing protein [Candidatus Nanohaloarchaea archaeon]
MEYFKTIFFVSLILFTFQVFAASDSSSVNVGVKYRCDSTISNFYAPGNGTIAKNSTGYFVTEIHNVGNFKANISVDYLNVTKQNSTYYPGDDLGPVVTDYNGTAWKNVPPGDSRYYLQMFNATYDKGYYGGHVKQRTTCNSSAANNLSNSTTNFTQKRHVPFKIVTAFGKNGGVNTTGNQTTNKTFPDEINHTGNETTNNTLPQNYSKLGNESVNKTIPEDANRSGETSDQTIEGNNNNPGQTPQPQPRPNPTPMLEIDMQPVNQTYTAFQGQYAAAKMNITNVGNATATDLTISPEIQKLRPNWQVRPAKIANLSVGEYVTRDVFVKPPEDQQPGEYIVPVVAHNAQRRLDIDYFMLKVNKSQFNSRISIEESPQSISVSTSNNKTIPVLFRNNGEKTITNVTARLQNMEDCGKVTSSTVDSVGVNETASLQLQVETGKNPESCNSTLIISSSEGAYAFSDVSFSTRPPEGLIPRKQRVPFIAIAWTVILAAYAVLRKRYNLTSSMVRIPFILLLMGETFILLYMVVNYYGVISVSFLPF